MDSCLFCKIVEGKIPSQKVYEDSQIIAIKDIRPQAPTHVLFVPRKHFASLADVPLEEMTVMTLIFKAMRLVADQEGISERGFRTVINTRAEGGQTVDHLHVHLLAGKKMGEGMTGP